MDYEIGYKKPPRSGCFQKNVSGNPNGRPKGPGKKRFPDLAAWDQVVDMTHPDGRVELMTLRKRKVLSLIKPCLMGDLDAIEELYNLPDLDPSKPGTIQKFSFKTVGRR